IKFIKIDEASKTVIQRLVDERGKQTVGAYDKSPDVVPQRMFPADAPVAPPADEDRTVMKPASELLEDALKKSGEGPAGGEKRTPAEAELQDEPPDDGPSPAQDSPQKSSQSSKKSRTSKKSSQSESRKRAAQKRAQASRPEADEDDE